MADKAVAENPGDLKALYNLAVHMRDGWYDVDHVAWAWNKLVKAALRKIGGEAEDAESHVYLGIAQYNLYNYVDAVSSFARAVGLDSTNAHAQNFYQKALKASQSSS